MKNFLCGLFVFLVLVAVGFIGFLCWTEWKHDKSAIQYIKDKIDKQEEVVEETTNDDIVVDDEAGEVEATASINF